ncbi:methyltransferase domain-containing protein [Denitratisoma oestradiolicum]|uniref:tRNA (guanine(46)-N(7))-methyltransferase n=1 Tax=Denitratisoma oestradiolicum TaxID=311182 RepID=A0A6S6Y4F9_9PROT|nr:methyltransferase domain-containing protein [Denitratisoma oestradiolicum]TWO78924.1 hypothetical protein CBW56_17350 [Denitratisoma oestradiolicum]CAB1370307.1 conserved membrane protein of unknown function [Denitratisoma oestradiolicum]
MPNSAPQALLTALGAQLLGAFIAASAIQIVDPRLWKLPLILALTQGTCAALVSYKLTAPTWWIPIHLAFAPLIVLTCRLTIAPGWYLGGFLLLLMVFWRTDKSQVPLYLSNRATADVVQKLLPSHPCRIIDLGCGNGGLLLQLARQRPDCTFFGIEHAPLPWLWAKLGASRQNNVTISLGNFWGTRLDQFDLVYAFLSPVPMEQLWQKAQSEMRPGSQLISNSFVVPGSQPTSVVAVADRRNTRLYVYRPGEPK